MTTSSYRISIEVPDGDERAPLLDQAVREFVAAVDSAPGVTCTLEERPT